MEKSQEKHYKNFEQLPFAPCFEPTEEEFKDALGYIAKIREIGEKYGIVKIKPPRSFQPPFAINREELKIVPRIQKLNELEALNRVRLNFFNMIGNFWHLQGSDLKVPMVENKYLDLYKLHKVVSEYGGYDRVVSDKKWTTVAKRLQFKPSSVSSLRQHYQKLIQPFEDSGLLVEKKSPVSPQSDSPTTMKGRRRVPEPNENADKPACKIKGGRMMAGVQLRTGHHLIVTPPKKKQILGTDPIENVLCQKCSGGDDEELLLICETCDDSYHTYCLKPQLSAVPKGDWRCPKCVKEAVRKLDDAFGFEQSECEYTLESFGEVAEKFKSDYFGVPSHMVNIEDVEKEFWRNVGNFESNVSVKYGADLFTDEVGSGFPRLKNAPSNSTELSYAKHSWNLNNLPILKNSVLSQIVVDISGMMIPWVYVGMCFSTFCWHTEDHWTYSINYLHWGAKKIWYGVSGHDGDKFEKAVKEIAPELFRKQPDLLHHIVTIMNPRLLIDKGVDIWSLYQDAGEFVITFPRSYHSGFNEGFNLAEAVNFAPADWLPMGRKCTEHYSEMNRYCVFSHDELICGMAKNASNLNIGMSIATYKDMADMIDTERERRKTLLEMGISTSKREIFETIHDDQRQCLQCKTTCYLSALSCKCKPERMVCLRHFNSLCDECPLNSFTLKYRYSMDELPPLMQSLLERTKCFDLWITEVKRLLDTDENNKPSIDKLKPKLEEAKSQNFPQCETLDFLTKAIKHADRCSTIAEQLIANRIRTRNRQQTVTSYTKKLKLVEVEAFVEQVNKLPCIIPQSKALQEFVSKVYKFEMDAATMFDRLKSEGAEKEQKLVEDTKELLEIGIGFDLQLDEVLQFKQELERIEWLQLVDTLIRPLKMEGDIYKKEKNGEFVSDEVKPNDEDDEDSAIPLDSLKSLLTDGLSLAKSDENVVQKLAKLQSLLNEAQLNEEKAQQFLNSRSRWSLCEAEKLLSGLQPSQVVESRAVQQFRLTMAKTKEWVNKFDFAKKNGSSLGLTEQLLSQSRQLPFDLESRLSDLRKDRITLEEFISKVDRLFQKMPNYHATADIIGPRRDLSALLEGQRCPLYPRKRKARSDDWNFIEEHESAEKFSDSLSRLICQETELMCRLRQLNTDRPSHSQAEICVCRSSPGTLGEQRLITCHICCDHFHPSCVNWDRSLDELGGLFLCARCIRGCRPRIEDVRAVLGLTSTINLPSREAQLLQHLLNRTQEWDSESSTFINSFNVTAEDLKLSLPELETLNRLVQSGLSLEISTDMTRIIAQLYQRVSPLSQEQLDIVASIRSRPVNSHSINAPLFLNSDKKSGGKRSHSPLSNVKRRSKRVYHEDDQQCSAFNCLRPSGDNVNWIQCESRCQQWFHIICVGLTVQKAAQLETYTCFKCMPKTKSEL